MVEMGAARFDCVPLVQVPFDRAARLCPKAPSVRFAATSAHAPIPRERGSGYAPAAAVCRFPVNVTSAKAA
jgi:hypothetical protein